MKASLKFREDQKPLIRAKIPLNIVGFPFQSGIVAGESKELSLNLATFFDSGPSFKFSYRPNNPINPFSLVFKTGIGHFGSPTSSSMNMSAEFNLVGSQNPSFFVNFKPQFGDFSVKKSLTSNLVKCVEKNKPNGVVLGEEDSNCNDHVSSSVEVVETPVTKNGYFLEEKLSKITVLPLDSTVASRVVDSVFKGVEVSARTALPVRNRAVVSFRWGVRFPVVDEEMVVVGRKRDWTGGISFRGFPLLVMNKIGIEHMAKGESHDKKVGSGLSYAGNADVAGACLDVKKQMEVIQAENRVLRKAMDDVRLEIFAAKGGSLGGGVEMGKYKEGEKGGVKNLGGRRGNGDKKSSEMNGFVGKGAEGVGDEELKAALMGSSGA